MVLKFAMRPSTWRLHLLRGFGWFFLALAIYVLSPGPVMKIGQVLGAPPARIGQATSAFYYPMGFLGEKFPPITDFYQWYLQKIWRLHLS